MKLLNWIWLKSGRAKKNEIYKISNIDAFKKAVDTVYETRHNGKSSKSSMQDLGLKEGDFVTCLGDKNNGLPSFAITIGKAWKDVVINMSPTAHSEPSLYGLKTLEESEKKNFTLRQRSLVR